MTKEEKLLKQMEELHRSISRDKKIVDQQFAISFSQMENQFAHMIDTYPEVFGIGGSRRAWLEAKADEYNIAYEKRDGSDEPWNQPNHDPINGQI